MKFLLTLFLAVSCFGQGLIINPYQFAAESGGGGTDLLTDLAAYYTLDESSDGSAPVTRADSIGAIDLTDVNTTPSATGIIGNGADPATSNLEHLSVSDNTSVSVSGSFTIAGWINAAAIANQPMLSKDDGSSNREYYIMYVSGNSVFRFLVGHSGGINFVDATSHGAISTGNWYFVVAWFDDAANTINIQVNNGAVNSGAKTTSANDAAAAFQIGRQGTAYAGAVIDEVGLWKRVLTSDERTWLYNLGAGRTITDF